MEEDEPSELKNATGQEKAHKARQRKKGMQRSFGNFTWRSRMTTFSAPSVWIPASMN
jgi:hypothetical protein